MTLVVATRLLKHIAVIADCRISYGPEERRVDDCLQKLYQVDRCLVLGFSGPVEGAHQVLTQVRHNLDNYDRRKRSVAAYLRKDVRRWIGHAYRGIENPDYRRDLTFLLASVEPARVLRPSPCWLGAFPEVDVLTLKSSKRDPGGLIEERGRGQTLVIGVEKEGELATAIDRIVQRLIGFCFKEPRSQAQVIMQSIAVEVTRRETNHPQVGGLLQCALLGLNGIEWIPFSDPEVSLDFVEGRFVQTERSSGRRVPLLNVWEWSDCSIPPGTYGAFEPPELREAATGAARAEVRPPPNS